MFFYVRMSFETLSQTEEAGNRCLLMQLLPFVSPLHLGGCPLASTIEFCIVRKKTCRVMMYQQSEIKPEKPAFQGSCFWHSKELLLQTSTGFQKKDHTDVAYELCQYSGMIQNKRLHARSAHPQTVFYVFHFYTNDKKNF